MELCMPIGDRLRELREDMELSQENLAKELDIAIGTISKYENIMDMDPGPISSGNVVKLAKFFNVSADYILGLTENKTEYKTPVSDLQLTDKAISVIKSNTLNNHLLSEIISHDAFFDFIMDVEMYIKGTIDTEYIDQLGYARGTAKAITYLARYMAPNNKREKKKTIKNAAEELDKISESFVEVDDTKYFRFVFQEELNHIIDDIYNEYHSKYDKPVELEVDFEKSLEALSDPDILKQTEDLLIPKGKMTKEEKAEREKKLKSSIVAGSFGIKGSDVSDEELESIGDAYTTIKDKSGFFQNPFKKQKKRKSKTSDNSDDESNKSDESYESSETNNDSNNTD